MRKQGIFILLATAILSTLPAMADDIDVFQPSVDAAVVRPTVLLTLDLDLSATGEICPDMLFDADCSDLRDTATVQDLIDWLNDTSCKALAPLPGLVTCGAVTAAIDAAIPDLTVSISTTGVPATIQTVLTVLGLPGDIPLEEFDQIRFLVQSIVNALVDNANLGVMLNHFDGQSTAGASCGLDDSDDAAARLAVTGCSNGAYVLMEVQPLLSGNASAFVNDLLSKLNTIDAAIGSSSAKNTVHPFQGKELYYEAVQYLAGNAVYNGHLGYWDYGDTGASSNLDTSLPPASWSTANEDGSNNYLSPYSQASTESCGPSFIINLTFGTTNNEDDSDTRISTDLPNVEDAVADGGLTFEDVVLHLETAGFKRETAANVFVDHTLHSYFLLSGPPAVVTAQTNAYTNISSNSVVAGVGLVLDAGLDLSSTFSDLELDAILGVPGSFSTPVQPVKAGFPAEFEPDTFIPMFKPDINDLPVWEGNLKKLTFDKTDNRLEDVSGAAAVNSEGRIADGVRTFWTDAPVNDGNTVNLGGAGSQIPGMATGTEPGQLNAATDARQLFFEPASGTTLSSLDNTALVGAELQSDLGAADVTEAQKLILYARGYDGTTITPTIANKRDWMMGAVLHSQPIALNYGSRGSYTDANPDIRILFGATDGFFRMIRNTTTGGSQSGEEVWGFMPRSVMDQVKDMRTNAADDPVIYGVDGAPAVYTEDVNGDGTLDSTAGDKVWLFFGFRRGGSAYYALDISDPDNPSFLWKISDADADYSEMALTFAAPRVSTKTFPEPGTGTSKTGPVLLVTAGYNGGVDVSDNPVGKDAEAGSTSTLGTDDATGNAIYMVDAETGGLIWKATEGTKDFADADFSDRSFEHPLMDDSIPSTITALDTDGDSQVDRGYVGDTGGRLWRIDMAGSDISTWTAVPILSVGRHNDAAANGAGNEEIEHDRRFFNRPDFVKAEDFQGDYDAIIIGSGDRADPYNITTRDNVYMFKDRTTVSGITEAIVDGTLNEADLPGHQDGGSGNTLFDVSSACDGTNACPADASLVNGWRFQLGADSAGEKMVSTPFTLGGTVFFTTFIPPVGSGDCTVLEGSGRIYGVGLANANPTVEIFLQSSDSADDPDGDDRSTLLTASGFSDSIVYIGDGKVLRSDLATQEILKRNTMPTFWRERLSAEEEPLDQD